MKPLSALRWNEVCLLLILKIILGVIAALLALLLVPVRLSAVFDGDLKVSLYLLFFKLRLYPGPAFFERMRLKGQRKRKEEPELPRAEKVLKEEGVRAVIEYYLQIGRLLKSAAERLMRAITVDRLYLDILVASGDAAQTAIDYGKVCAVVYPVQALIESKMRVRRRAINISTDFLHDSGELKADIRLHAVPIRVLWAILLFFIGYAGNTTDDSLEKIAQRQ